MERSKTQEFIDEIMDYFEFSKVQRTMEFLKWKIVNEDGNLEIPDESELRRDARQQIYRLIDSMKDVSDDVYYSHCGPFKVRIVKEDNEVTSINLDFVVTYWEAYDFD